MTPPASKPHSRLDEILTNVKYAEKDGWYAYGDEAVADVKYLLEQLETQREALQRITMIDTRYGHLFVEARRIAREALAHAYDGGRDDLGEGLAESHAKSLEASPAADRVPTPMVREDREQDVLLPRSPAVTDGDFPTANLAQASGGSGAASSPAKRPT